MKQKKIIKKLDKKIKRSKSGHSMIEPGMKSTRQQLLSNLTSFNSYAKFQLIYEKNNENSFKIYIFNQFFFQFNFFFEDSVMLNKKRNTFSSDI